jgi:hypothetical protein
MDFSWYVRNGLSREASRKILVNFTVTKNKRGISKPKTTTRTLNAKIKQPLRRIRSWGEGKNLWQSNGESYRRIPMGRAISQKTRGNPMKGVRLNTNRGGLHKNSNTA